MSLARLTSKARSDGAGALGDASLRQRLLAGLLVVLLAGAAWWNYSWMTSQRRQAQTMAQDLAVCLQAAEDIERLRAQPRVASVRDMGVQELGQRIEQAMQQAQLPSATLESVAPQSSRRVGDTPYVHKPTALSLRGATLTQLVTMLYHLTNDTGLSVRDLRLRTSRSGTDEQPKWDAQVTVVYLLYAPTSRGQREVRGQPGS